MFKICIWLAYYPSMFWVYYAAWLLTGICLVDGVRGRPRQKVGLCISLEHVVFTLDNFLVVYRSAHLGYTELARGY